MISIIEDFKALNEASNKLKPDSYLLAEDLMARLTAKARSKIPAGKFAGPGRSFPVEDKNHAKAALIDVGRAKGLSSGQKAHIRTVAKGVLGKIGK